MKHFPLLTKQQLHCPQCTCGCDAASAAPAQQSRAEGHREWQHLDRISASRPLWWMPAPPRRHSEMRFLRRSAFLGTRALSSGHMVEVNDRLVFCRRRHRDGCHNRLSLLYSHYDHWPVSGRPSTGRSTSPPPLVPHTDGRTDDDCCQMMCNGETSSTDRANDRPTDRATDPPADQAMERTNERTTTDNERSLEAEAAMVAGSL